MALVKPTWMIDNGVKADPFDRDALLQRCDYLITDVGKPFGAALVFDARFRYKYRLTVTDIKIAQQFVEWTVPGIVALNKFAIEHPLVVNIIITAKYVEVAGITAELGPKPA